MTIQSATVTSRVFYSGEWRKSRLVVTALGETKQRMGTKVHTYRVPRAVRGSNMPSGTAVRKLFCRFLVIVELNSSYGIYVNDF